MMWKDLGKLTAVSFVIIAIFTFLDITFHMLPYYHVPDIYFVNKLIFGTILLFFGLLAFEKIKTLDKLSDEVKAFVIGLVIVFLLQLRYIELYPFMWNVVVVVIHKLILVPLIWLAYKAKVI